MMDLTKTKPRSVHATMLGIVQLARTTDKAKAKVNGTIGDYNYDCSMDRGLFEYLGINAASFLDVVKNAKDDSEISMYANGFVSKKDPVSIATFNKKWLSSVPTGESLEHFNKLRARVAPDRTDVTSWPDLLDLEEGRSVPHRELVRS
jgi:hypothetical protein